MATLNALLITLAALLLRSTAVAKADTKFHTLPSGRHIPLATIVTHPLAGADAGDHALQLFEVSDRGILTGGPNLTLALHAHTAEAPLAYDALRSVKVNGRDVAVDALPASVERSGPGFAAVYVEGDERPVSIALESGHFLEPLHFDRHPGVYISSIHRDARSFAGNGVSAPAVQRDSKESFLGERGSFDLVDPKNEPLPTGNSDAQGKDRALSEFLSKDMFPSQSKMTVESRPLSSAVLPSGSHQLTSCGPRDSKRFYEIVVMFDNSLCARFGNYVRTFAKIQSVVNRAQGAFSDVCLRLALVQVVANCGNKDDPFRGLRGKPIGQVLSGFAGLIRGTTGLRRDVAVLVTGFKDNSNLISLARDKGACTRDNGYATTEVLVPRSFANMMSYTLGGPLVPANGPLRLPRASSTFIRGFLETDRQARCINRARRRCSRATCGGQCVSGVCVTGVVPVVATAPPPRARKCGQTFVRARPVACIPPQTETLVSNGGDRVRIILAVQFNKIFVDVSVLSGLVGVSKGVRVGKRVTAFNKQTIVKAGKSITSSAVIADLATSRPGKSCCGEKAFVGIRIIGCRTANINTCGAVIRQYTVPLVCKKVCSGRGTPLPMTKSRKCPFCRK